MNGRERLTRIHRGQLPDRAAIKHWGLVPGSELLHPAFEPVLRRGLELSDLVASAGSRFDLYCGRAADELNETREEPTDSDEWVNVIRQLHTPEGTLRSVYRKSTVKKPGYDMEHLLKEPGDIKKLLSIPYDPFPFDASGFHETDKAIGDRGITMFGLDHAMYGLQRLIGSENFALWSIDCRDLLVDAMGVFAERIREHARRALDAGLRGVFGWCGPELCIPPLMGPRDFDEFATAFDKPLIDMVHEAGGCIWVHCHGKMGPVLERFVEMGVDVLNPIEPPPMGDLTLEEAFDRVGDRMALEGNIETHDFYVCSTEQIREKVHVALNAGKGKRHILCPSAGYMECPFPPQRLIDNLLLYIEEGVRFAEQCRQG